MATIIYLHGFASVGTSPKSDALIARFGKEHVFAPDLPIDPDKTISIVIDIVRNATSFPIVFVGTSLGGFWAHYFGQLVGTPCVIVNPAMNPSGTMSDHVGVVFRNYKSGEEIIVTPEHLIAFERYRIEACENSNSSLIHLFLAEDDDLIDYKETCERVPCYGSRTISKNGGHRYTDHWELVIDKVQELVKLSGLQ